MPLLILVITILMPLRISPCVINCLTHFVSAWSTSYNMQCQFNKDIYRTIADHRKYHSPLDGHCYKNSEA